MKTLSKNILRLWSILAAAVATTSADRFSTAQEPGSWKRVPLTKEFYSEGGAIGDLDNDGQVDVIAGPNVYWGPEFKVSSPIYDGKPFSINGYSDNFFSWTFDVDQDGQLDVIVAGFPGQQGWWFKNPGPQLARTSRWTRLMITEVVDNESPEFLDITGDGKPELVCSQGGRYCYLEIPKDPTQPWAPKFITEPGGFQRFTHGLGVGDVNDDGRKDLLAQGGWWEQPTSLTSEGPWKFHPFEFTPAGGAQMHAVDLDGDGKAEVVTSLQAHGYGLAVFKKLDAVGDKFERIDVMTDKVESSPTGLAISQLHAVAIADVDRDGIPDIVTGKRFWAHQGHDPGEHEPVLLVWFKTARTGLVYDSWPTSSMMIVEWEPRFHWPTSIRTVASTFFQRASEGPIFSCKERSRLLRRRCPHWLPQASLTISTLNWAIYVAGLGPDRPSFDNLLIRREFVIRKCARKASTGLVRPRSPGISPKEPWKARPL